MNWKQWTPQQFSPSYSLSSGTHSTSLESYPQLLKIPTMPVTPPKIKRNSLIPKKEFTAEMILSPPHHFEPFWVTLVPPSLTGFHPLQWQFPPHTHLPTLIHLEQHLSSRKMMERQSNGGWVNSGSSNLPVAGIEKLWAAEQDHNPPSCHPETTWET